MDIKKIIIKNYRSISGGGIELNEPDKINLFIGKNNSGKSNLLRFIKILSTPGLSNLISRVNYRQPTDVKMELGTEDHHFYKLNEPILFSIYPKELKSQPKLYEDFFTIIGEKEVYATYSLSSGNGSYRLELVETFLSELPDNNFREFEDKFTQYTHTRGGAIEECRRRVENLFNIGSNFTIPKVEFLDEYRKPIKDKDLRVKMNDIVNPDFTMQDNIIKKKLLCKYFKSVFGLDVDIKIPNIEKEIELEIDGRQNPLSSLGAGLQEVVLIAFILVTTDADIVCIDEPELHIHPGAQRELLNLISSIENKTFFFATHSNHFLDYEIENKKIYQLKSGKNGTEIFTADNTSNVIDIMDDLGIRASEIYQTNGIIWVEGASDRVYIKKWIELIDPSLKEGLQYTFQYYGGKVLSNYSISDDEYKDYLNILSFNRNGYIVMDSDMNKDWKTEDLRETKQRIIQECAQNNVGYWVTKGKEIENYLTERVVLKNTGENIQRNIYAPFEKNYLSFDSNKKVSFARNIVKDINTDDIKNNYDLEDKINEIIHFINKWNN